jgi:hypothetical protein
LVKEKLLQLRRPQVKEIFWSFCMPHLITYEKNHHHPIYNKKTAPEHTSVHEKDKTKKIQTSYDAIKNEVASNTVKPKQK